MHYIRFLKTPRRVGPSSVGALITITNDLGDDFLAATIPICAHLEDAQGKVLSRDDAAHGVFWHASCAQSGLSVQVDLPSARRDSDSVTMYIGAARDPEVPDLVAVRSWQDVLAHDQGGVVGIRAPVGETGVCERVFDHEDGGLQLHVWEETGNSIARHIWDAGLVLAASLTAISARSASPLPRLPCLEARLGRPGLKVIELGAGCGIVGLTLARLARPNLSLVTLTDLPAATSILTRNLSPGVLAGARPSPTHAVLDWTAALPPDVAATAWDLVLVADCTYNPDSIPDLVATFGRLAEANAGVMVLLAMKDRHRSEGLFFPEMKGAGWEEREKAVVRVPVLGGEGEEIRIFVYQREKISSRD